MDKEKLRFTLNFFLFFSISFFNTQLIPFLKSIGYNHLERGIILAVNALFSIVLQIVFGYLCDHFKTIKKFFYLGMTLFLLFGVGMYLITKQNFFLHIVFTSMMASMVKVLSGLIETWMLYLNEKKYGLYRSFGALGLCIGSPIAGILSDVFSYIGLVIIGSFILFCTLWISFYCDEVKFEEKVEFKQIVALLKNKPYMYMMLIYFLIFIVGSADQYIVVDKMIQLKGSAFLIGSKWALQALMEIPFFLFAAKILKKYNPYVLLKIAVVMYGIKFIFYGFSSSIFQIILSSCLQLVTLPVVAYTSKVIFASLCPNLKASSQMCAMAIFVGGSAFVAPLIIGVLTPMIGIDFTLFLFAFLTIIPFFLLLCKKRFLKN